MELTPESAAALDTLGWILYQLGEYGDALDVLSRALDQAPRVGAIHYHLGMAHYRLGAWTQATSALRRATELDPELAQREAPACPEPRGRRLGRDLSPLARPLGGAASLS